MLVPFHDSPFLPSRATCHACNMPISPPPPPPAPNSPFLPNRATWDMSWDHTTCFTLDTLTLLRALERKERGGILNFSEKEREEGGEDGEGVRREGGGRDKGEGKGRGRGRGGEEVHNAHLLCCTSYRVTLSLSFRRRWPVPA